MYKAGQMREVYSTGRSSDPGWFQHAQCEEMTTSTASALAYVRASIDAESRNSITSIQPGN